MLIPSALGLRIGEAQNPGPEMLEVSTINVTSARTAACHVEDWGKAITCLQETRHSELGAKILSRDLKEVGWDVHWGHPVRSKTGAPWDTEPGGVATMTPQGVIVRQMEPTHEAGALWELGRLQHLMTPYGDGANCLHIVNVYGYANTVGEGATDRNESLLAEVFAYAAAMGQAPVILCGDFNASETKSKILASIDRGEAWTDLSVALEEAPSNTYCRDGPHPGMEGAGITRPDRIYANIAAAAAVRRWAVMYDMGVPSHAGIRVTLDLEAFEAPKTVLNRINPYETNGCLGPDTEEARKLWKEVWETYRTNFMTALRNSDMDNAYGIWARCAENYLSLVTEDEGKDGKLPGTGRWKIPTFKVVKVAAPQNEEGEGISTTPLQMKAMKLYRRVKETCLKINKAQQDEEREGPTRYAQSYVRQLGELQAKILSQDLPPQLKQILNWTAAENDPTCNGQRQEWERSLPVAKRNMNEKFAEARAKRKEDWKRTLEEDWKQGGSLNYLMLKEERTKTVRFLAREDGSITANPKEMHELVKEAWLPGVMRKYDNMEPPTYKGLEETFPGLGETLELQAERTNHA